MSVLDQARGLRVLPPAPRFGLTRAEGRPLRITVTSGKGGVGKSTFSASVSVALAEAGHSVLLVDADLGLASLDLLLGVSPEYDLMDVLKGTKTPAEIIVKGPSGVDLLPACPGRYEMANLPPAERARIRDLIEELGANYDVVLIDTGAGIGSNAVEFAVIADEVVLVATADPTSLRDAYAMAKVLERRADVHRVWTLASQVSSDKEGRLVHERLAGIAGRFLALEMGFLGSMPRDPGVSHAAAAGMPIVVRNPDAPAARAVRQIARLISARRKEDVPC